MGMTYEQKQAKIKWFNDMIVRDAIGRPRKTLDELDKNWERIMMDLSQQGKGQTHHMVFLGITDLQHHNLQEDYEAFRNCVKNCKLLEQMWYEDQALRMITGGAGNFKIFAMMMYNKFGWTSGQSNQFIEQKLVAELIEPTGSLTQDQLREQLKKRGLPATLLIEQKQE